MPGGPCRQSEKRRSLAIGQAVGKPHEVGIGVHQREIEPVRYTLDGLLAAERPSQPLQAAAHRGDVAPG